MEVAAQANPPVCRLMDYGKVLYELKKKQKEAHKHQKELKEISVSFKIGEHDLMVKVKKAKEFLSKGHKVKINLILRGREKAFASTRAMERLKEILALFEGEAKVEQMSKKLTGDRIFAILTPLSHH